MLALSTENAGFDTCNALYQNLPEARKQFVNPVIQPEDEYRSQWEAVKYSPKPIESLNRYETDKGDIVRSKSEVIIANALFAANIPYRYEYPLLLKNNIQVHPDFTILNTRTRGELYWEHFGMMSDKDYCEKALHKLAVYEASNIVLGKNLIITMEGETSVLNTKTIKNKIETFLR